MSGDRAPRARRAARPAVVALLVVALSASVAMAAGTTLTSQRLTPYRSCTLTALSGGSAAGTDSWVDQASAGSNNGTDTSMNVRSLDRLLSLVPPDRNRRIYLRFDLTKCSPAIPASATIHSSSLRLFVNNLASGCRTQDLFRVITSWTETGITWTNQPFGTANNNPASGTRTDAINVGGAPCTNSTVNAYVTGWNVTTDVAAFVAGTATNNGWMIRDDAELSGSTQENVYYTREHNSTSQSPQLIINYRT